MCFAAGFFFTVAFFFAVDFFVAAFFTDDVLARGLFAADVDVMGGTLCNWNDADGCDCACASPGGIAQPLVPDA